MKKRLFIHIGSHKTATTYLQSVLSRNSHALSKAGIIYPKSGRKYEAHHPLAWRLSDVTHKHSTVENIDLWINALEEINMSEAHSAVISSEDFEWSQYLEKMACLRDYFDVYIVFYLRSPDSYIESFYNQVVKDFQTKETRTLENYIIEQPPFFLNCYDILKKWEEIFGRKRIIVRLFNKKCIKNGIENDFLSVIGCKNYSELNPADLSVIHKKSLPSDALEFLRLCNKYISKKDGHYKFVLKLANICLIHEKELQTTRSGLLSIEAKRSIRKRFGNPNKEVSRVFLGENMNPFPPNDAIPHPDYRNRLPAATADTVAFVASLLSIAETT